MKRLTMFAAILAVVFSVSSAFACNKEKRECPFAEGKARWMLTELEGEGFLVNMVVKAEGEEGKEIVEYVKEMVEKCSGSNCQCKNSHHCPFAIKGLNYAVSEVDTGLEIKVTGGCPGKQGAFKKLMEATISGKDLDADKGGCPHADKHKKKGGCPHADKDVAKGDCGCGKKKGDCGCGKKKGDCGCGKKKGDCGCH